MLIDLHTHSTVSDGTQAPAGVVESARAAGLDVLALTDHDSTDGWAEARNRAHEIGLGFVPGMEISCRTDDGVTVHLLSYLHDPHNSALAEEINRAKTSRLTRAKKMVSRLSEDFPITWTDVTNHVADGATIGRPHIADTLVTAGIAADRKDAFDRILTSRSKYWVSHYAPDPAHAVELVRAAGGVPVFAHPMAVSRGRVANQHTFDAMIAAGLAGVEVYHRDNPESGRRYLLDLAAAHNLIITGSSDYHGAGKPNRLGENTTPVESLRRILRLGTGSEPSLVGAA